MTDGRTRFADDQTLKDLAAVTLERDEWRQACLGHGEKAEAAERERDQLRAKLAEYDGLLCECDEYFDNRADADMDQDGYIPNEEMKMLTAIRARSRMGGENAPAPSDGPGPSSTAYDQSGYAKEAK